MYLRWKNKETGKYVIAQFDACSSESVESILSITKHPVEDGDDVSDYAHPEADKITIEGYVSNTPLPSNPNAYDPSDPIAKSGSLVWTSVPLVLERNVDTKSYGEAGPSLGDQIGGALAMASPGGLTRMVTGAINGLLNPPPTDYHAYIGVSGFSDRARDMYLLLREAQRTCMRIEVGIKVTTIFDMMIAKLHSPRTAKEGQGATFQLDMQRVRIVKSATVNAPDPAEARGQPAAKLTPKAAEDDGADKTELKSFFASGVDGVGGNSFLPKQVKR